MDSEEIHKSYLNGKIIGFIGFGFMAQSLAKGFLSKRILAASQIAYFDPNSQAHHKADESHIFFGCSCLSDNLQLLEQSDIVILAVKPQVALPTLQSIKHKVTRKHLIISICAGITIYQLQNSLPSKSRVVRTMPNTPASVGCGATAVCGGDHVEENDGDVVVKLFSSVGFCVKLPENQLNAVTAISGSGPAFAYIGLDAVGDAGALLGLPKDISLKLAAYTMMGAAKMFLESEENLGTLKDAVCSPGGTTLEGQRSLERSSFRSTLMECIVAAHDKSKLLAETAANDHK